VFVKAPAFGVRARAHGWRPHLGHLLDSVVFALRFRSSSAPCRPPVDSGPIEPTIRAGANVPKRYEDVRPALRAPNGQKRLGQGSPNPPSSFKPAQRSSRAGRQHPGRSGAVAVKISFQPSAGAEVIYPRLATALKNECLRLNYELRALSPATRVRAFCAPLGEAF
jgi:hypothetical protein